MNIYLIAIVKSKPENREAVLAVLLNMVEETRKEEGSIKYDLHQNIDNPNEFVFYEIWKDAESITSHEQTPHIQKFIEIATTMLAEPLSIYKTNIL